MSLINSRNRLKDFISDVGVSGLTIKYIQSEGINRLAFFLTIFALTFIPTWVVASLLVTFNFFITESPSLENDAFSYFDLFLMVVFSPIIESIIIAIGVKAFTIVPLKFNKNLQATFIALGFAALHYSFIPISGITSFYAFYIMTRIFQAQEDFDCFSLIVKIHALNNIVAASLLYLT